ncbi:tol-like protein [Colletotrichum karsti]|uniref:Tol-like protein n=1 Tax=Colletotrichum karsti TaxID=1095194 RepID=A0A9P6IGA2_9PEZI|nr:tol-like protein [Colletotrichum karsti]KAF9882273.1 tol-like protein [Colletotrichum karsti]
MSQPTVLSKATPLSRKTSSPSVNPRQEIAGRNMDPAKLVLMLDTSGENLKYLPQDCIQGLVTRKAIADELGLQSNDPDSEFTEWILKAAPKLFLITLSSQFVRGSAELRDSMRLFQLHGFDDSQLPWTDSSAFPDDSIKGLWERSEMTDYFPPAQWKLLALVMDSGTFTYKIRPGEILPFTRVLSERPKEGAFGKVYRVKVQPSHTDYSFEEIAIKEIRTESTVQESALERAWLAEVGVLKMVKKLKNRHIIECLAAIERSDNRYLLFPWADGGSLRDYWEAKSHQKPTQHLVKEAVVQIRGLAVALRQLHYFGLDDSSEDVPDDLPHVKTENVADEYLLDGAATSIRHGDLKPENLLWFSQNRQDAGEDRCLKIADMGLAKRHVVRTQDRSRLTATTYGTILYEAPEAEPAFGQQPRSRLYDIWSMGCIVVDNMAEFLGDPRFPEKAMRENSRAIKIRYFQDLYRRYSQLEFTHIQDRPIAIAGLENRLRKAYWTKGGFGIFDDGPGHGLFHRSLLWQRGEEETSLKPIDFTSSPESAAPTWSWMAHEGGIDYLDPPFQQMEWEQNEIEPPWSVTGGGSDGYNPSHLKVVVRPFDVAGAPGRKTGDIRFIYDNPNRRATSDRQGPMCVVIAKEKQDKPAGEKRHYVLVVLSIPGATEQGQKLFTRLGVGYMPGKCITLEGTGNRGLVR